MKKTFMGFMNPKLSEIGDVTILGIWWAMVWRLYAWIFLVGMAYGIISIIAEGI